MRRGLAITAALLILLAGLASWLAFTGSGLRWLAAHVTERLPVTVSYDSLDGRLFGPFLIKRLAVSAPGYIVTIEDLELDWSPAAGFPRAFRVNRVRAASVVIEQRDAGAEASATNDGGFEPPSIEMIIDSLQIYGLAWIGRGAEPVTIREISVAGSYAPTGITIRQASALTDTARIRLAGAMAPRSPFPLQADVDWQFDDGEMPAFAGHTELDGNLAGLRSVSKIDSPAKATVDIAVDEPFDALRWRIDAATPAFTPSEFAAGAPPGAAAIEINASGDRKNFAGTVSLHWPDLLDRAVKLDLDAAIGDGVLTVGRAEIALAGLPGRLSVAGSSALDGDAIRATLDWTDLQWPLDDTAPVLTSNGHLAATGRIGNLALDGDIRFADTAIGAGTVALEAVWRDRLVAIEKIDADLLEGRASAKGEFDWRETPTLRLDMDARGLNTAVLPGGLESDIALGAGLQISADQPNPRFQLVVRDIRGELAGHSLSGDLRASGTPEDIRVTALNLRQGSNSLSLNGRAGLRNDLRYRVKAPELGAVHGALSGSLTADGRLSGSLAAPAIAGSLNGESVQIGQYTSSVLDASFSIDIRNPSKASGRIDAQSLRIGDATLGDLRIRLDPNEGGQRLTGNLDGGPLMLDLELIAGQDDDAWRGEIARLSVGLTDDDAWQIDAPVGFVAGPERATLPNSLCLRRLDASLCVQGGWAELEDWRVLWSARNLKLATFEPYFALLAPDTMRVGGTLSAQGRMFASGGEPWQADGTLYVEGGSIFQIAGSSGYDQIAFVGAYADYQLDPQSLKAGLRIDFGNEDYAQIVIETPRSAGKSERLTGRMSANVSDLSRAPLHFREFTRMEGTLRINAELAGTRSTPTLSGRVELEDAAADLTDLGVLLEDIVLVADADLSGVALDATARSGEGEFKLDGRLEWQAKGAVGQLRLTGEGANAVNLPEARVRVSPDLRITLEPESLKIDGNIDIPYARIQPLTIASARYPSADTVIVGEAATEAAAPRELAFDVAVTVGNDVRFDGFGLAARLGGNLRIRNRQGVTIGNGELNVRQGSYTIGTAKLDIQSGALLFAGGPVNNPGLSVRGVRQMQTVTVGVNVGGTLRQPEISLFSDPPMRQSDIISYLAFAKPASTLTPEEGESVDRTGGALAVAGAGIAAADISSRIGVDEISIRSEGQEDDSQLVLGKYVTPRIYVSYGFGLFEPINTLRLRLNITNRLLLLTESGLEDSADILYTWDR